MNHTTAGSPEQPIGQGSVPLPRRHDPDPHPPAEPAPVRERRVGLTPVTLFLTLLVAYVLIRIELILVLTLLALVFATAIERPVHLLERQRIPRPLAILTVYITIIASITIFFILLAPVIADQADHFREDAPVSLGELRDSWQESSNPLLSGPGQQALQRGIDVLEQPSEADVSVPEGAAIGVVTGIGGGIVGLLTLLVIAFYYLMEKALIRRLVLLELAPASRERVDRIWSNVEAKVGDWLRGQLTLCLVIGLTATIGYGIMGVRFWPLLGLWAGLTEIVPIVGPWIGGVPAVIIALTMSWQKAILVTGFIVMLQLMENTVLVPRIMRGAVGLSPLTVFVAILAGTQFLGLAGAVLAIPIAAAVQVFLTDYLGERRALRTATATSLPGWRWMRGPGTTTVAPATDVAAERQPTPADQSSPGSRWSAELRSRVGFGRPDEPGPPAPKQHG